MVFVLLLIRVKFTCKRSDRVVDGNFKSTKLEAHDHSNGGDMFKKILSITIAGLLIQAICVQCVSATSKEEKQAQRTEKVRSDVLKLGTGSEARIAVKLRDSVKLAGYISEANAESFVVTDIKTRATTTVAYRDVTQVKGHNLGTGAKIAIGAGIGAGVTILILWLYVVTHED